jgi:hypothetical protein
MDNPWAALLIPGEPTALHSATWKLCLIMDTTKLEGHMKALQEQWTIDLTFQKRLIKHPTGVDVAPTIRDALKRAQTN